MQGESIKKLETAKYGIPKQPKHCKNVYDNQKFYFWIFLAHARGIKGKIRNVMYGSGKYEFS